MRSWTSPCEASPGTGFGRVRKRGSALAIAGLVLSLIGFPARGDAARWQWAPSVGAALGYENDSVVDPDLGRTTVPGGSFLDFSPGLSTATFLNPRTRLRISGQAVLERFLNEENRTLLGTALTGDLLARSGGLGHLRLTLAGTYYSDSEIETANRFGGGLEAAAGVSRGLSWVEILGGVLGRQYPNLAVSGTGGESSTYAEGTMRLGVQGGLPFREGLAASGLVVWQKTDSRDIAYDGTSWFLQGTLHWGLGERTFLEATGIGQYRHFPSRAVAEDSDSYWQLGAGLRQALSAEVALAARYAYASYSPSAGGEETIHRATLGVEWRLGAPRPAPAVLLALPLEDAEAPPLPVAGRHVFRFLAPGAKSVALVGDFNGWDPHADPMHSIGQGWWECSIDLPPGSYPYAYRVDGKLVTPPEADTVIEDGFGGRNGVIRVVAAGGG